MNEWVQHTVPNMYTLSVASSCVVYACGYTGATFNIQKSVCVVLRYRIYVLCADILANIKTWCCAFKIDADSTWFVCVCVCGSSCCCCCVFWPQRDKKSEWAKWAMNITSSRRCCIRRHTINIVVVVDVIWRWCDYLVSALYCDLLPYCIVW